MSRARDASLSETPLQSLEDRLSLMQLEGAYSTYYDGGDGAGWASLFTEDGIYQTRQLKGQPPGNFVQGHQALAEFCNSNRLKCIHFLNVPDIRLVGDDAFGRVNFKYRGHFTDDHGHIQATEVEGFYDVAYRRTEAGWRIRRRFTVYFERTQKTIYGYEPSVSQFEPQNPPIQDNAGFVDAR
tara:strand:+ start:37200 stop:37748 length:549 start_codon:yes stop_codon:yes gene_type:complete